MGPFFLESLGLSQRGCTRPGLKAVTLDDHDHQAHCIWVWHNYKRDYEGRAHVCCGRWNSIPNDTDVLAHAAAGLALIKEHDIAVDAGHQTLRLTRITGGMPRLPVLPCL